MIQTLENEFDGIGEMQGFKFTKIKESYKAYLYKVEQSEGNIHFEVFERKNSPICIDFKNRVYSETEFKEIYPKSNSFGLWAWCITDFKKAIEKFELITL